MIMSKQITLLTGLLLAGFAVSGCSSSDDDDDDNGTVAAVAITADNAEEVASAAMTTVRLVGEFDLSTRIGELIQPKNSFSVTQTRAVIPSQVVPCQESGTQTLSGDVFDPSFSSLTAGDIIVIDYDDCQEFDGVTTSGTLNLSVQGFSGSFSTPPYSYTVEVSTTDFSLNEQGETRSLSGSATFLINTDDGIVLNTELSIDSLDYSEQLSGDAGTLRNFNAMSGFDLAAFTYSQSSSGTLSSQNIGGEVDFETTTPFTGTFSGGSSNNPDTGVMLVTGAIDSRETITVLDSVNVQLEVDVDGDDTVEQTIQTTWETLFSL